MSKAIIIGCQEFAQNAWKKDLCSNCYKPRADHRHCHDEKQLIVPPSLTNDNCNNDDDANHHHHHVVDVDCSRPSSNIDVNIVDARPKKKLLKLQLQTSDVKQPSSASASAAAASAYPWKPLVKDPIYECHLNQVLSSGRNIIINNNINSFNVSKIKSNSRTGNTPTTNNATSYDKVVTTSGNNSTTTTTTTRTNSSIQAGKNVTATATTTITTNFTAYKTGLINATSNDTTTSYDIPTNNAPTSNTSATHKARVNNNQFLYNNRTANDLSSNIDATNKTPTTTTTTTSDAKTLNESSSNGAIGVNHSKLRNNATIYKTPINKSKTNASLNGTTTSTTSDNRFDNATPSNKVAPTKYLANGATNGAAATTTTTTTTNGRACNATSNNIIKTTTTTTTNNNNNNNNINNNNNNNNNVVNKWTTSNGKKIGSTGALIWEVGQGLDDRLGLDGGDYLNDGHDENHEIGHNRDSLIDDKIANGVDKDCDKDFVDKSTAGTNRRSKTSKSILRDGTSLSSRAVKTGDTDTDDRRNSETGGSPRRGSVGFLDGAPKVIGYGGRDYEWDDENSSDREDNDDEDEDEEEDSLDEDLRADDDDDDSLESFQLSAEEKAFTRLTDQNTEFNADNSNLLTTFDTKSSSNADARTPLVTKLSENSKQEEKEFDGQEEEERKHNKHVIINGGVKTKSNSNSNDLYSTPIKSMAKSQQSCPKIVADDDNECCGDEATAAGTTTTAPLSVTPPTPTPPPPPLSPPPTSIYAASSSANAQEFIRSNLYSTSPASASDTEDFLDATEELPPAETSSSKPPPPPPTTIAKATISKDNRKETMLKVGHQSVPVRLAGSTSTQRASVQNLFKEEPVTAAERRAAALKQSTTHSSQLLQKNGPNKNGGNCSPYGVVPVSGQQRTTTTNGHTADAAPKIPSCPPPDSDDESQRLPIVQLSNKRNNFKSTSVNDSCHYASSYVRSSKPDAKTTNPYSTPVAATTTATTSASAQTDQIQGSQVKSLPAIKPKPKLPAKPSSLVTLRNRLRSQGADANDNADEDTNSNRKSVVYQEIDENPEPPVAPATLSMTSGLGTGSSAASVSVENGANSSSRRVTKRRAPKPPKELLLSSSSSSREDGPVERHKLSTCLLSSLKDSPRTPSTTKGSPNRARLSSSSRSYTLNSGSRTSSSSLESYCSRTPSMDQERVDAGNVVQNVGISSNSSKDTGKAAKKSRFSLKKLLKFGAASRDGVASSGHDNKGGGERRERLEILHPIDLMQNKNGTDAEIALHGWTSNENKSAETSSIESPKDKPPPPRRFRTQESQEELAKEKPARPPPPAAASTVTTTTTTTTTTDKQVSKKTNTKSSFENLEKFANNCADKRSSIYDSGIDYANLGDVRNSVAPKKPGRCTSSMTDISIDHDADDSRNQQMSSSQISLQNYDYVGQQPENEAAATYYSSTNDASLATEDDDEEEEEEDEDDGELYADQVVVVQEDCEEEESQSSSLANSDITASAVATMNRSSSSSSPSSPTSDSEVGQHRRTTVERAPCKVYEVVVVKGNNLEKVYSKLPVISADETQAAEYFRPAATSSATQIPFSSSDESKGQIVDVQDGRSDRSAIAESDAASDSWHRKKSSRLSLRKAKSVIHKNLEDNYGAVVSANHQTLTQILDQVSQSQHSDYPAKLKQLQDARLRWTDFTLLEDSRVTVSGKMAFYSAQWQQNIDVTLMVSPEPLNATIHTGRNNPCVLVAAAEFEDDIPREYVIDSSSIDSAVKRRRATVWVLERMRVETLATVAEYLRLMSESDVDGYERECCFVLLQLINGLKHLQVQGTEEVDGSMDDFLLVTKKKDTNYRFLMLPEAGSKDRLRASASASPNNAGNEQNFSLSLCRCALDVMLMFLSAPDSLNKRNRLRLDQLDFISTKSAFRLVGDILMQERATSLSQAKLLLEYMIWGPSDQLDLLMAQKTSADRSNEEGTEIVTATTISDMGHARDQEKAYQRWLDLERATVLNNLIRTQSLWQIRLTVFEEYMLSFLVRTCAKTLREAAAQLQMAANSEQNQSSFNANS